MSRILIIEDEVKVANSLKTGLEEKGYGVDVAFDGQIGQRMAGSQDYDAIILDINLPHVNGYAVCEHIRRHNQKVPVLMLTALDTTEDKITGFDLGADDYLVKPFEFRELQVRLRALLKRADQSVSNSKMLKVGDLVLNLDTHTVSRDSKEIELTAKEYLLLEYLMRNRGRVISKSEIAERIWDVTFDTGTNVIEVYINFLRRKIDRDYPVKLIHTQKGMGYILKERIV
jgi:DNA-binding response OmpR family regulator